MSTSMQFINTNLKEFEKESQIFIQQTPVLRNDEEFCLFAVKIMNQIINNYLELDVAFVRLFTLCRLFCDGTRQKEAKYVKRLNIFIISSFTTAREMPCIGFGSSRITFSYTLTMKDTQAHTHIRTYVVFFWMNLAFYRFIFVLYCHILDALNLFSLYRIRVIIIL
eukprot:715488_1